MAAQSGQRNTGNVASIQKKIDISDRILNVDPSEAPYTVVLKRTQGGGAKKSVESSTFKWSEDDRMERWDTVNDADNMNTTDTTMVVDNGSVFYKDALVLVPRTGEIVRVTGVSTNSLTIVRGQGGTSAANINDGDPLYVLGPVFEEGVNSADARSENPVEQTNYTQIFKTSVEGSGTWLSSSNETSPHDWDHQKKKAMVEHLISLENAALFGKPASTTGPNSKPLRLTGGLLHFQSYNATAVGGSLTESAFDTWLGSKAFAKGSDEKVLFASDTVINALMGFAKNKLDTTVGQKEYGVNFMTYVSPYGKLAIVRHKLLTGAIYGGYAVAVDFKGGEHGYRFLKGDGPGGARDTHVQPNIQAPDYDGRKDQILTEAGFQIGLGKTGARLTGVTG
jgi:hypothetical protein